MSRIAVYDSEALQLIISGIPIDDGRPKEDSVIEITFPKFFESESSADGLHIRYKTNETAFPAKLKLMAASTCTAKLWALVAADVAAVGGLGIGPFLLLDGSGLTKMTGSCYIDTPPTYTAGNKLGMQEWGIMIVANLATMALGGNVVEL